MYDTKNMYVFLSALIFNEVGSFERYLRPSDLYAVCNHKKQNFFLNNI